MRWPRAASAFLTQISSACFLLATLQPVLGVRSSESFWQNRPSHKVSPALAISPLCPTVEASRKVDSKHAHAKNAANYCQNSNQDVHCAESLAEQHEPIDGPPISEGNGNRFAGVMFAEIHETTVLQRQ